MLKDEIQKKKSFRKNSLKQLSKSTQVNLLNSQFRSSKWGKFVETNKKNYKVSLQTDIILKVEIKKY
jgi:hypothetical protein